MDLTEFKDHLVEIIGFRQIGVSRKPLNIQMTIAMSVAPRRCERWQSDSRNFPPRTRNCANSSDSGTGCTRPGEPKPQDDPLPFIETEHEVLREYGFYVEADGDPETFLAEYIDSLKKEAGLVK